MLFLTPFEVQMDNYQRYEKVLNFLKKIDILWRARYYWTDLGLKSLTKWALIFRSRYMSQIISSTNINSTLRLIGRWLLVDENHSNNQDVVDFLKMGPKKKPVTYLEQSKDCLFFAVHCQFGGSVILTSTRHRGSVLMLSEEDIQRLATEPFLFTVPEAFLNENAPVKYSMESFFDEDQKGAGAKIFHVSQIDKWTVCLFTFLNLRTFFALKT